MIYNGVDTDVFQHFLDELALSLVDDPTKRRILILDNASWHKTKRLNLKTAVDRGDLIQSTGRECLPSVFTVSIGIR